MRIELTFTDGPQLRCSHYYETVVLTIKLWGQIDEVRQPPNVYNAHHYRSTSELATYMLPVRFSFEHTCLHRSGIKSDHFGVDKEGARPVSESAASKISTRKLYPNPTNHKLRLAKQHRDSDNEVSAYFK